MELEPERERLRRVLREQGDETDLSLSLGLLSKAVHRSDAYWLDTSSNDLISAIVRDLPHDMVRTLEALLDRDAGALARDARAQIDGKKYDATFRAEGIKDIEKIVLAYFKDKVELCKNL